MVAGEENLRDAQPIIDRRPRVLSVLEEPVREGLVTSAHLVAKGTGKKPHDRVDDHKGRQLPAREHIVPKGEHVIGKGVGALVHPLIARADEQEPLLLRQPCGNLLVKALAAGREEHDVRRNLPPRGKVAYRLEDGGWLHEHALSPSEGGVVNRPMPVVGPVSKVMGLEREDALGLRAPHDRGVQVGREDAGEDREGLDDHSTSSPSTSPDGTLTMMGPASGTSTTTSSTTGTRTSPKGPSMTQTSFAGPTMTSEIVPR